ncbi:DUF6869 domain-containing protein [Chthoniobacter flavus]|uniref:DUF6869 domain-containing protein n=1 Tax=Chthoniobacter flavus TaxID=191863 RepID=UPI0012FC07FA|nr:hypothetical protein [Chthoniobacter flavus]
MRELAEAWIAQPRPDYTKTDEQLYRWLREEPDRGLATICAIAQLADVPETVGLLAAGPLEDFLCLHEEKVFDTVHRLADEHELFRVLLRGVWPLTMSKVFYQKIRALSVERL